MKLLVTVPLCDYEPFKSDAWSREALYYIVEKGLTNFAESVEVPLDLYILSDRSTAKFVRMAENALRKLRPTVIDNSKVGFNLSETSLPERQQHVVNQFLKTIELSKGYDALYFCEQDYFFKKNCLKYALQVFEQMPEVNLVSMFDHPDRHDPKRETELGHQRFFQIGGIQWKSVSSLNANWIWRTSFIQKKYDWLLKEYLDGALDYRITNSLYKSGELLLCPSKSLMQHVRLDGLNQSPTFGVTFPMRMLMTKLMIWKLILKLTR